MEKHSCVLTFTGDIMSNMTQNAACRTAEGYDYGEIFLPVREILNSSDLCVGNLETVFGGAEAHYSEANFSFNTPDEFAIAVKEAGFDLVSTANNHCLDREVKGLKRTLDLLDRYGIRHTGTARSRKERDRACICDVNGIRVGFVGYTYGTNAFSNKCFLKKNESYAVNLLQPQETLPGMVHLLNPYPVIAGTVKKLYSSGVPEEAFPYLEQLKNDIANCRKKGADYVIVLLHCGGQYITEVDSYTEKVVSLIRKMGADAIVGNHQHVIQKFEWRRNFPVFHCLGNFAYTPGGSPASRACPAAEISAVADLRLEKKNGKTRAAEISISLTRSVIREDGKAVVYPLYDLYRKAKAAGKKKLAGDFRYAVNTFLHRPVDTEVKILPRYQISVENGLC